MCSFENLKPNIEHWYRNTCALFLSWWRFSKTKWNIVSANSKKCKRKVIKNVVVSFTDIALALIAFVAPALAQQTCDGDFFRWARSENSCQAFFFCFNSNRINFSCDSGEIFDENRARCRPGDAETCEFVIPQIPADECANDFFRIAPHPDPDQCWRFFMCMNNNLIEFACDVGYIFSSNTNRCVLGSHTYCEEGGLTPFEKMMQAIKKN